MGCVASAIANARQQFVTGDLCWYGRMGLLREEVDDGVFVDGAVVEFGGYAVAVGEKHHGDFAISGVDERTEIHCSIGKCGRQGALVERTHK